MGLFPLGGEDMAQTKITITHDQESTADIQARFITYSLSKMTFLVALQNFFNRIIAGTNDAKVVAVIDDGNAASATDTITFTASNTAADTVLINGVTLTCVASGAVNNQWNIGAGTATQQAAAFVAAVNASTTSLVSGLVSASNLAGVVTLTSTIPGIAGNSVTVAKGVDTGTVMTVLTPRLTGGVSATNSQTSAAYAIGM